MSRYSRIFHHINIEDVKEKRLDNIRLSLIQERKKEERIEPVKHIDWRTELSENMTTSSVFIDTLEPTDNDISDTPAINNVDMTVGFDDGAGSRAAGTGIGYDGGFDTPGGSNYLAWQGTLSSANRSIFYLPIDTSQASSFTIQAIQGDYNNGAKAAGSSSVGVYAHNSDAGWTDLGDIIPASEANYIQWHTSNAGDPQGFRGDTFDGMTSAQETEVRNLYSTYLTQSGATATATWMTMYSKIYSYKGLTTGNTPKSFSIDLPDAYRAKNTTFQLYQLGSGMSDPWSSSGMTNPYAITSIVTKRTSPMSLVVSLDSPEASAFIRDGGPTQMTSREKKRKEVELKLEAAKKYVEKQFGKDFPGSKYTSPGRGVNVDRSPQNPQDQYAAWADTLTDKGGNKLFPGGYQNFIDRHTDMWGNLPTLGSAGEKIKMLQYMKPPFVVGKMTDSGLDSKWIKSINAYNAREQARARREAELKKQLLAFSNKVRNSHQAKTKAASQGDLNKIVKSKGPTVQKKGPVVHQNDPSPEANPWSKKSDFEIASHDKPFSKYPPAGGPDKWPGIPSDKMDILHPKSTPQTDIPLKPFGMPWKTAARGGEIGKVAGVGDALKGLFGLGPEAEKKAKERSKRFVGNLKKKSKLNIGSGQYDLDAILNQGDDVEGTPLMEKKLKKPKQFFNPADIKPEYPEEDPPQQVMGYHPNLVDGEKVSNRYNKLDPISAKAMPLTGNPHIDAKVVKARKKRAKLVLRKKNP